MFFYFLIVPALVACLCEIYRLRKLEKHDIVLYKFCEIRRLVMARIREDNFNLSKDDYVALRQLAEAASLTIHDYNEWKTSLFNFRKFKECVRKIKNWDKIIEERKIANPDILALYKEYIYAMFFAFLTYTPFIKSEMGFRAMSISLNGIAHISMGKFKRNLIRIAEFIDWVKQKSDNHNTPLNPRHST